jgi:hypothetical protein
VDGVQWYWCALRRVGHWRIYSGAMPVPPSAAEADLLPALDEVVRQCREVWN